MQSKQMIAVISIGVCAMASHALAQVFPASGYSVSTFSTLQQRLSFEATLGAFMSDGRLVVTSRDAVGPEAHQRVLAVSAAGIDSVIGPEANYPNRPRVLWEIGIDPTNAAAPLLCLDSGQWFPNSPMDGFMTRLNPSTGVFAPVTLPTTLVNPRAIARFPNGDLLIGDVGLAEGLNDGRIIRISGSSVTTLRAPFRMRRST